MENNNREREKNINYFILYAFSMQHNLLQSQAWEMRLDPHFYKIHIVN